MGGNSSRPVYQLITNAEMPLLLKLEDSVPKPYVVNTLKSLSLKNYSQNESNSVAEKLMNDEIPSLVNFVNESDEKLCNLTSQKEETALSIAIYRVNDKKQCQFYIVLKFKL